MRPSPDPSPVCAEEHPIAGAAPPGGLVFLIGCDPDRPSELPWPALAALAAADAVLHDAEVGPSALALVPARCFTEPVAPGKAGGELAAARALRLAAEGWRVVRLASGDPALWPLRLAEIDRLAAAGIATCMVAGPRDEPEPASHTRWNGRPPLAAGLDGLAG
jgi:hypothetical protein